MERSSSEDNSVGEYSSEEEFDEEDYEAFEDDDSDENNLDEPNFMRMTSKQIGSEYSYSILDPTRLFSILQTKIVAIKDRFEYINLTEGKILDYLRKNHFLVENTVEAMNDNITKLMEEAPKPFKSEDVVMCMVDLMDIESHHTRHLGCGHQICTECWGDYITQKISEGPSCINAKCPVAGCSYKLSVEIVEELTTKKVFGT